jgi:hypothetical protein
LVVRLGPVGAFGRPVVNVTVPVGTLLGVSEEPGLLGGELIPAGLARRIAGEPGATWYRLLTDAAGRFVELSTQGYAPTGPIERAVVARDQVCTWPGCRRAAVECELDHRVRFPRGATSSCNLHPLCKRHHRFKHSEGVRVVRNPDGSTTWRTRYGSVFWSPAPEYPGADTTGPIHTGPIHTGPIDPGPVDPGPVDPDVGVVAADPVEWPDDEWPDDPELWDAIDELIRQSHEEWLREQESQHTVA